MKRLVFALICVFALVAVVSADTAIFYSNDTATGVLQLFDTISWEDMRSNTTGSFNDGSVQPYLADAMDTTNAAGLNRGVAVYNTSALPDTVTITGATIGVDTYNGGGVYVWTLLGDTGVGITKFVIDGSIDGDDYNNFQDTRYSEDKLISTLTTDGQHNNWSLNSAGLSNISKTSESGFMFRLAWDIDNSPPSFAGTEDGNFTMWTGYTLSEGQLTFLEVTYVTETTPVAAFSANRTSGTSPLAVKFTDASTGSPTIWKWYWYANETLSSSEQNPEFSFPEGTYNVRLNATSASGLKDWENKTAYISTGDWYPFADFTGSPTSGTPGLLVSFTDTSTYGSSSGLVCNWSFGDSLSTQPYSSTCGNVQHVYIYAGIYDVNYTIVNDNGTSSLLRTGYISASTNQQTQTTYYNPRQVGLTFQDSSFKTLDNLQIVATPLNFTAPDNWTELLIGIQPSINILGTSVFGTTDSGGGIVFPMVQSIRYNIDASGTTSNGRVVSALNFTLYPSQEDYLITLPVDGAVGPLTTIPPTNYISYTLTNSTFNSTAQMINLTYTDPTSGTDNVTFFYRDVEGNISYVESVVGAGANAVSLSTFVIEPSSGTVEYGFIANQSSLGTISQTRQLFYVNFVGLTPGGVWTWVEMWTAIGIIVLVSALFSRSSVPLGGIIIVGLTGFFTWGIGWIHPAYGYATMFSALFILGGYAVLLYMRRAEDMIS